MRHGGGSGGDGPARPVVAGGRAVWDGRAMRIDDLPTPCLVLDRPALLRNLQRMQAQADARGVALRPHLKTAKSVDVARLAAEVAREAGATLAGLTVSTLAEAEYFTAHDFGDVLYAVGITPAKLDQVAKLNAAGAQVTVVTDDLDGAEAIAAHAAPPRTLIEIDTGEGRGGVAPDDPDLTGIAERLGAAFAGVMTHAGHSYDDRSPEDMARTAEQERAGVVAAAERLSQAGHSVGVVSMGSTPTALHATSLAGITELRPGVYMFGDLFQAGIGAVCAGDLALTVLASVIGRRPAQVGRPARVLLDAGAIALSKDRSTQATPRDFGFGLMLDLQGERGFGRAVVRRVWQEHALVELDPLTDVQLPALGQKVRLAMNHACLTAAAHDRYYVVESGTEVAAVWSRVGGW
jgi:D-serine deaminase-like pyridoxal phosphate-dependent protein